MVERVDTSQTGFVSFAGRIGVARADITPPVGIFSRTWGAAQHEVAESIHRPLTLSALTLANRDRRQPLVLIEADASWWQSQKVWQATQTRLLESLSLEPHSLVFAVSHTHAAPPLTEPESGMPGGDLLAEWVERLTETAVRTAREALANACDATLDWHVGRCPLASVRDFPEPVPDSQRMVCGYNPRGVPDDSVLVGRVTDVEGRMRATLCNYACHPTTLAWENRAISPDYVGAMRETIQDATGVPALFVQGASGELAPRHQYVGDARVADQHGRQLGYSVLAILEDMGPAGTRLAYQGVVESGAPLAIWRPESAPVSRQLDAVCTTVDLPLKEWPSADELDRRWASCGDRVLKERTRRRRNVRRAVGDGTAYALPVWIWRIGEAALVGCRTESYSLLQRELRRRFPDRAVVVGNLMNGSIGYLPTADCYEQNIYQVWQTPFARGALEAMLDAVTESMTQMFGSAQA